MPQTEFLSSEISKERGKGRAAGSILSPAGYLPGDLRQVVFSFSDLSFPIATTDIYDGRCGVFFVFFF